MSHVTLAVDEFRKFSTFTIFSVTSPLDFRAWYQQWQWKGCRGGRNVRESATSRSFVELSPYCMSVKPRCAAVCVAFVWHVS